jgi:hypothetical protein
MGRYACQKFCNFLLIPKMQNSISDKMPEVGIAIFLQVR